MGSAEWWVGHAGCLYQKHDARWSPIGNDDSQKAPRSFPSEQKCPCHSAKPHKSKGTLWDRCATHQSTTTTVVLALPDMFHPNHFTLNHLPSWGPIPHSPLHIPRNQTGSRLGSAATLVFCNRYSATYQFVAKDRKSPTKICYQFVAQTCKHLVLWRL